MIENKKNSKILIPLFLKDISKKQKHQTKSLKFTVSKSDKKGDDATLFFQKNTGTNLGSMSVPKKIDR